MYVQINKKTRNSLQNNVIATMMMGSHAHGLNGEESDKDILYIYYDKNYGQDIFWESNGWQYKIDGVDENYQEIRVFIRNLITAKMCGNLEALLGGWKLSERLSFNSSNTLNDIFNLLATHKSYAIAKSYAGYAKKDIKNANLIWKQAGEKCVDSLDFRKKIAHILRGLNTIAYLLDKEEYQFYKGSNHVDYHLAKEIKFQTVTYDYHWFATFLIMSTEDLQCHRDDLNEQLNSHKITRRGDQRILHRINDMLKNALNDWFGTDIEYDDNLRLDIIEKGENFQYM